MPDRVPKKQVVFVLSCGILGGSTIRSAPNLAHRFARDVTISLSLFLLCDGGGSNSSAHYIFEGNSHQMVNDIGAEIRVAHYPFY